jgi:type IV pilus assembly protein PilW
MAYPNNRFRSLRRQAGLTIVEFMVAIVIGMLLVAAIATLIANQSGNRAEVDRAGRIIENGRFALSSMATDVQMAGYWGELNSDPTVPSHLTTSDGLPGPCNLTVSGADPVDSLESAMGVAVQGYNSLSSLPSTLSGCVSNYKTGTDILVVRRLDPDTTDVEKTNPDGSISMDLTKLTRGQVYVQTGLDGSLSLKYKMAAADPSSNATTFNLTKKTTTSLASIRKYVMHIYYISKCSVEVSGSCTNADGGSPIPTLKRMDLGVASNSPALSKITIAEGIENMQIDYGKDTDTDGMPNGVDTNGATFGVQDWTNVMSLKIYLLARSTETSPGYTDTKTYSLGSAGAAPATNDGYKRHVFVQSVRLVNPSMRRS